MTTILEGIERSLADGEELHSMPEGGAVSDLYISVELNDERTLRTWIIPISERPTAYMDALHYGKDHDATVIWGAVRPAKSAEVGLKMAVIFDHGDVQGRSDILQALTEVAGCIGENREFDIREQYSEGVWRSVSLP